jgi:hypothetical protein
VLATPDTIVQPAHLWVPEHVSTAGGEAADLASSLDITLDPEQRFALDIMLAERADGRWASFENGIVASRQNLKTFLFLVIALSKLYLFDSQLVVWTAHLFPTTMEAFRAVKFYLENYAHLSRRLKRISEANGEEGVELMTGQRLLFKARTKSGGRGLTGDDVFLDEAFALGPSEMGSLLPTMSARPNPQLFYGSSAGLLTSEVLRAIRDRGRAGGDPSLAYIEWSDDPRTPCANERCDHHVGAEGCALDNPVAIRRSNPALGRRISLEHIRAERRALSSHPLVHARERLGWWEDPETAGAALPLNAWNECRDGPPAPGWDERAKTVIPAVLAFDVALDSSWSAIAVCGMRADGYTHVEVVDYRDGTDWLAERLIELSERYAVHVLMDGKGPGKAMLTELAEVGIAERDSDDEPLAAGVLVKASTEQLSQACGGLVNRLKRRALRHIGQPELDIAVRQAVRRDVTDSWLWSRSRSPVDISPLVAVTLALWGAGQPVDDESSVYDQRGLMVL